MLYACFAVVAVFIIFIITTFFITRKNYSFEINDKIIKVSNCGSILKIFVNNDVVASYHMPQLIQGETYKITIDEKDISIKCRSNSFGTKLSVKAYCGENEVYNNGIEVKIKDEKKKPR